MYLTNKEPHFWKSGQEVISCGLRQVPKKTRLIGRVSLYRSFEQRREQIQELKQLLGDDVGKLL